ncbi:hypothetical protein SADUNF_Sadunf15G0079200 [Salix dunnii]|uniref:ELP3-like N-terminal domain-containing protein n=1 Tax=Salix dunnii TaxID=1413687 RepID=A0A835JGK5_9ROSI|nr:hypothetical protein SADUNF_Sadunf15G0079200 [Salix dunnii]
MATAVVTETKKLSRPGRGYQPYGLTEEEARVRAIAEIVNSMADLSRKNQTVDLNALKSAACRKYGLARAPKLVEMIAALPDSDRESLLPKLRAKPARTASGIAVAAVTSKPHRCPHIATTGNICVYNPYVQARSRIDQLKRLGHSVDKDILAGLLRLRKCGRNVTCPELMGKCSIVRELHVYGTAVPVHGRDAEKLQHQGYGTLLMEEAEQIARKEHRSTKIAVISGVGTRVFIEFLTSLDRKLGLLHTLRKAQILETEENGSQKLQERSVRACWLFQIRDGFIDFGYVKSEVGVCEGTEISMEMGSETFDDWKLRACRGRDRVDLRIGVLILSLSLPRSPQMWEESLRLAIEARPKQVPVYDLQVHTPLPCVKQSAEFYRMTSKMLTGAGFWPWFCCYPSEMRFSRPRRMKKYVGYVENGVLDCCGDKHVDAKDFALDIVMFSPTTERRAMTADGFNTLVLNEDEIAKGLAYIQLRDPDGFLLSNKLISHAFRVIDP